MAQKTKEPSIISYLRNCSADPNNELAAVIKGKSCSGLGIRPKVLAYEDKIKVYGLSGKQVSKVLETYDKAIAHDNI